MIQGVKEIIQKVPKWILMLYALIVSLLCLLATVSPLYIQYQEINYRLGVLGIFAVLILGYSIAAWRIKATGKPHISKVVRWIMFYLLPAALLVGLHAYLAVSIAGDPYVTTWDAGTVFKTAAYVTDSHNVALNNFSFQGAKDYFTILPNNLGVLTILTVWFKVLVHVFGTVDFPVAAIMLNTILIDVGIISAVLAIRLMAGKKAMLVALVFFIVLVVLSPWSRTYYSDTVGLCWVGLLLLVGVLLMHTRKYGQVLLLLSTGAFLIGTGYSIKPTIAILGVSGVICVAVYSLLKGRKIYAFSAKRWQLVMLFVVPLVIAYGSLGLLPRLMNHWLSITPQQIPMSHFMMIGLDTTCYANGKSCTYGAYNEKDWVNYTANYGASNMHDEYANFTYAEIVRRIDHMGPLGYAHFLSQKGSWVIGDGMFYAYGEGGEYTNTPTPVNFIQHLLVPQGKYYRIYTMIVQAIWYVCLVFSVIWAVCVLRRKEINARERALAMWMLLSLIGLIMFLLMFEARSRYIFLYLPFFIGAAAMGMQRINRSSLGYGMQRLRVIRNGLTRKN